MYTVQVKSLETLRFFYGSLWIYLIKNTTKNSNIVKYYNLK